MFKKAVFAISTIAVVAVGALPGAPAYGEPTALASPVGVGVRLAEVPEGLAKDPRAQIYVVDNVEPGTTFSRKFEVWNQTGVDQTVRLYPGAADISPDGTFAFRNEDKPNELSTWVKIDPPTLLTHNGDKTAVTATFTVPKDAGEGERYGVLWAEVAGASPDATGSKVINRIGVRVYLSVGPGNGPQPGFTFDRLTPRRSADGTPELVADVTNTGGRAVDVVGQAELANGPGGISVKAPKGFQSKTFAPGMKGQVVARFDRGLPNGPWDANLKLSSGLIEHVEKVKVTFPDSGTGASITFNRGWPWWIWLLIAIAILIAAAAAGYLYYLRRKSDEPLAVTTGGSA